MLRIVNRTHSDPNGNLLRRHQVGSKRPSGSDTWNQTGFETSSRESWTSHQRRFDEVPRCKRRHSRGPKGSEMCAVSTCERMGRPRSHRPSRIPTDGARSDERLFVVLCDVVDVRGNRCWWLVAVDQHTDFSVIAPCPSHESQAVAKHIFKHWTRWAGPLGVLVCDGERGLGATEIFKKKKKEKTLCVRDSGANHSSLFSVAEGSSRAKDRNYQGSGGQDDFATLSDKENQRAGRLGGRRRRASKTFHHSGVRARSLWKNMLLQKRSGEQLLRVPGQRKRSSPVPSVSFTDSAQANEQKRPCEDDIWDLRL